MEVVKGGKYPLLSDEEVKEAMSLIPEDTSPPMPVVLHVALQAPGYSSAGICEGFRRNGWYVEFFNWQVLKIEFGVQGMIDRLLTKAQSCNPRLIFLHIQSPDIIDPDTCDELKKIGYTVLYTFDCREKDRSQWMYDLAPHVDLLLFSNIEDVRNCISTGYYNAEIMQSSADLNLYQPLTNLKFNYEHADIVFVGGDYSKSNMNFPKADERKEMVDFLIKNFSARNAIEYSFLSYGMGQEVNRYIQQHEENLIYNAAKIAISQSNYARTLYTSDRIWRIMASGCFCLAEKFEGIESLFEVGIHLDTWESLPELKDKINFYLSNEDKRKKIAAAGCEHVRTNHSWQARFRDFIFYVENNKRQ